MMEGRVRQSTKNDARKTKTRYEGASTRPARKYRCRSRSAAARARSASSASLAARCSTTVYPPPIRGEYISALPHLCPGTTS